MFQKFREVLARSRLSDRAGRPQEAHSNTIAELLREVGMPAGDPCRSDYLAWLAQQRTPEGTPVPPRLLDEIARAHVRLRLIMEQLAEIEEQ